MLPDLRLRAIFNQALRRVLHPAITGASTGAGTISVMADARVVSQRPDGWRWIIPVVVGALVSIAGLVAIVRACALSFWPVVGLVTGLCVAVDRLLAVRSASITVEADTLRTRTHLGMTAKRRVDQLLTLEWHDGGWRNSVVLNFEHVGDNVTLSAQGFRAEEIEELAHAIGKPFLRGATLYGEGEATPDLPADDDGDGPIS